MKAEPTSGRAIRIVSQCATEDEFAAVFQPYLEPGGLFVSTGAPEAVGARLEFVMTLAGGEPILRGTAVVQESHRDRGNFYGLRGMKLRFDHLDDSSRRRLASLGGARRRGLPGGRRPAEMVECLIFEEPGSEAADPLAAAGRAPQLSAVVLEDRESAAPEPQPEPEVTSPSQRVPEDVLIARDTEELPPLSADDDVTAVAPPPRVEPAAGRAASAAAARQRFIVPKPRSEPAIVLPEAHTDGAAPAQSGADMPVPDPAASPAPPAAASHSSSGPAPGDEPAGASRAASAAASSTGASAPSVAAAADHPRLEDEPEVRRQASEPRRPGRTTSEPAVGEPAVIIDPSMPTVRMEQLPVERRPPAGFAAPHTPPPEPRAAPRPRPIVQSITPTEIVSPLALERAARGRPPLPPERTDVVRVSTVRTAAMSATLGALLGLAAGYFLWGMQLERPATAALQARDASPAVRAPAAANDAAAAPAAGDRAGDSAGSPVEPAGDAAPGAAPTGAPATGAAPAEARTVLRLRSTPSGAAVLIDGEAAGQTPLERELTSDDPVSVSVRLRGFQPWTRTLSAAELDQPVEVRLERAARRRRR